MSDSAEDWDNLFLRFLSREADADLERRIGERLLSDPSSRRRFVLLACQQRAMSEVSTELSLEGAWLVQPSRKLPGPWKDRSVLLGIAVAVLVAILGLTLFQFQREGRNSLPQATKAPRQEPSLPPPVPQTTVRRVPQPIPMAEKKDRPETVLPSEESPPPNAEVPEPTPERKPDPPKVVVDPAPKTKESSSPSATKAAVAAAVIDRAEGEIWLLAEGKRTKAGIPCSLLPGEGVETAGPAGVAELAFSDGTRLRLDPGTVIREVQEAKGRSGKRLLLSKGALFADVRKQPANQPMVLQTPHGEVTVLGTKFSLTVPSDELNSTQVQVTEGKVRLKRLMDGKSVDVVSGHFAVAAAGSELKARPSLLRGLVGHWKFEESGGTRVIDASGEGNHGTAVGKWKRAPGAMGQGLDLNGASTFVEIPHSPSLNPGASPWTVAAWVRTRHTGTGTVVYKDNEPRLQHYYSLLITENKPVFVFSQGEGEVRLYGKTRVNDGKWHHLVGVRTGPFAAQVFVDGILEATYEHPRLTDPVMESTSPVKFGVGDVERGFGQYVGQIDEILMFKRALSADEIRQLSIGK